MPERYKAIYLSPHLDDAALSCGGQIFQETAAGNPILIFSPMAGEPAANVTLSDFAKTLHGRWELAQNAVAARRAEDIAACHILGADCLHGEIPDCIYRTDPATGNPLYPSWQAIITTQHPADAETVAQLVQQFKQLPSAEQVYAPLTVGNHVDHRLVRQAAEQLFGTKLRYYEDYPYAAEPQKVTAVLSSNPHHWQTDIVSLSETAVAAKVEAIWAYASQMSTFFNGRVDLEDKIRQYTKQVGGERIYWHEGSNQQ